jgi:hypothetical protein
MKSDDSAADDYHKSKELKKQLNYILQDTVKEVDLTDDFNQATGDVTECDGKDVSRDEDTGKESCKFDDEDDNSSVESIKKIIKLISARTRSKSIWMVIDKQRVIKPYLPGARALIKEVPAERTCPCRMPY